MRGCFKRHPLFNSINMKSLLIGILTLFSSNILSFAQNRLDTLLNRINDKGKSDYVMIVAHRGDWRNAPENTIQAFQSCIDKGIDGIEIDVQKTKDGEIIICHDDDVSRTTNGKGKISEMTLAEIKQLNCCSGIHVVTRHKIPTYREVLRAMKGKVLIQVDKWQPIKDDVFRIAEEEGCLNQLIIRGTFNTEVAKKTLGRFYGKVIYIPVLVSKGISEDNVKLDDYLKNLNTPVISLSFKEEDADILKRVKEIKSKGYRIWYNSMWAIFNGGHDDEMAEYDKENSYGWLLKKGADIIFCDRPFLLDAYLKSIGRR